MSPMVSLREFARGLTPGSRLKEAEREVERLRRRAKSYQQEGNELARELKRAQRVTQKLRARVAALEDELLDSRVPEHVAATVRRVRAEHLTYLALPHLSTLARAVLDIEADGVPGALVEAGTARGGSAIVMAAAKSPARPMYVYDVFDQIPPPSDRDGADVHERYATIADGRARGVGGELYYGYRDDLYAEVSESFTRLGVPPETSSVQLVKGLFQDTIDLDEPIALAHLDGDWYDSTMTCLERIAPLISPGGRIVLDDYYAWSGCREAVDDYLAARPGFRREARGRLHLVRED
ncbi:TylF/MycF/NovP-related O-methyltransferase [Aeromicrobium duanguangcaii]|uniref:TylF/MycF/NovP-related O-methyltransferase n=1 Tax=Aeromicrobium duanguangcaii TaxID=2968086 RepID=UPI002017F7B9|nr:TylF/MycF/NovP-related O-methyltransferase [Aeromicrobium duanguangcaii]MCL3838838.1 TylF/MycF family methyltransferase [Aeromicrobium duanguangcaii]